MNDFKSSGVMLKFPEDEGAHENVKHEWWYFNGLVKDEKGNAYGFMICFFNIGKLYIGVTDEDNNKFYTKTIYGNLKAARDRLSVSIDNHYWNETEKFNYVIHIDHEEIRLHLNLKAERPPLLVGGQGQVAMGNGGNSFYYSQTRLKIDGSLMLNNEDREINGLGWIDRQWGNWNFHGLAGWEWFGIHLDNGSDILLFNLFDAHTGALITPELNIMHADGTQETLDSFEVDYLDYWIHSQTGDRFSHGWRIRIPGKDTELVITPTVDNQLLHAKLWEGSCNVSGKVGNKVVNGRAYFEELIKDRGKKKDNVKSGSHVVRFMNNLYQFLKP